MTAFEQIIKHCSFISYTSLFVHPFIKYVLNSFYTAGPELDTKDINVCKIYLLSDFMGFTTYQELKTGMNGTSTWLFNIFFWVYPVGTSY